MTYDDKIIKQRVKDVLKKVKKLRFSVSKPVNSYLGEGYHSVFKGQGMEFDEVREYSIGDDPRSMDWNVTARYGKPFVKMFKEERELTVFILADLSGSMNFGTVNNFKKDSVIYTASTLAAAASVNNDKTGLIAFPSKNELYIAPDKGEKHIYRIIHELLFFEPEDGSETINDALRHFATAQKKRSIVFVISDFFEKLSEKEIEIINKRHNLVAVNISDPCEFELPPVGLIRMKDAETGEINLIDSFDENVRREFKEKALEREKNKQTFFKRHKISVVNISTGQDYSKELIRYFKRKS